MATKHSKKSRNSTPVANVGDGYNTFFETAMPTQVAVSTKLGTTSLSTRVYVCTSEYQFCQALGINAAMDVDGG
jgi:hypothetical protein